MAGRGLFNKDKAAAGSAAAGAATEAAAPPINLLADPRPRITPGESLLAGMTPAELANVRVKLLEISASGDAGVTTARAESYEAWVLRPVGDCREPTD